MQLQDIDEEEEVAASVIDVVDEGPMVGEAPLDPTTPLAAEASGSRNASLTWFLLGCEFGRSGFRRQHSVAERASLFASKETSVRLSVEESKVSCIQGCSTT